MTSESPDSGSCSADVGSSVRSPDVGSSPDVGGAGSSPARLILNAVNNKGDGICGAGPSSNAAGFSPVVVSGGTTPTGAGGGGYAPRSKIGGAGGEDSPYPDACQTPLQAEQKKFFFRGGDGSSNEVKQESSNAGGVKGGSSSMNNSSNSSSNSSGPLAGANPFEEGDVMDSNLTTSVNTTESTEKAVKKSVFVKSEEIDQEKTSTNTTAASGVTEDASGITTSKGGDSSNNGIVKKEPGIVTGPATSEVVGPSGTPQAGIHPSLVSKDGGKQGFPPGIVPPPPAALGGQGKMGNTPAGKGGMYGNNINHMNNASIVGGNMHQKGKFHMHHHAHQLQFGAGGGKGPLGVHGGGGVGFAPQPPPHAGMSMYGGGGTPHGGAARMGGFGACGSHGGPPHGHHGGPPTMYAGPPLAPPPPFPGGVGAGAGSAAGLNPSGEYDPSHPVMNLSLIHI